MAGMIFKSNTAIMTLLILITAAAIPAGAGGAPAGGLDPVHTLYSGVLGEERRIKVHLPQGYEESKKDHAVIIMFDADMTERWERACRELDGQADESCLGRPLMIGICNTVRSRDMIPVKIESRRETGGSDAFLGFIEDELIPWVENEYRVSGRRILFGNSNSALFALYALLVKPALFQGVIAGSPMIGHCGGFMDGVLENIKDTKPFEGKALFMIYGEDDSAKCADFVPAYEEKMRAGLPESFRTGVVMIPGEGHVPHSTFVRGLAFLCQEEG